MKQELEIVKVFSIVKDKQINKNIDKSPIWKKAKHWNDVTEKEKEKGGYLYTMYFDGSTPESVTSVQKI
jgi:hypothetical protein